MFVFDHSQFGISEKVFALDGASHEGRLLFSCALDHTQIGQSLSIQGFVDLHKTGSSFVLC